MATTRRMVIENLGYIGGVGAAFLGMELLGLVHAPPVNALQFALPPQSGNGKSVVILGAGIAGLVAAYELQKAGWTTTVLEAADRVGGRVWTIRRGDRVRQIDRDEQICRFSDGLHFDAGAMRIPHTHHTILRYARDLGVDLEVMVNSNRAAKFDLGGRIYTDRELRSTIRGHISSLLAKAIDQRALDTVISNEERGLLREFLSLYGDLDRHGNYQALGRAGFAVLPGAYEHAGRLNPKLALTDVLDHPACFVPLVLEEIFDQQAPMLQPKGGMDQIARALHRTVEKNVRLKCPVSAILRKGERVQIQYGERQVIEADYCICTLPPHLLVQIQADFSSEKRAALQDVGSLPAVKVAFESPRFWEEAGIYGGLGWTDQMPENIVYPSGNWHDPLGVLIAGYVAGWTGPDRPVEFGKITRAEQLDLCRQVVERMHPDCSKSLKHPVVVDWARVPFAQGVGVGHRDWSAFPRPRRYQELLKPEGPIHFAGDHLSYVVLWQEGAALSAQAAVKELHERAQSR